MMVLSGVVGGSVLTNVSRHCQHYQPCQQIGGSGLRIVTSWPRLKNRSGLENKFTDQNIPPPLKNPLQNSKRIFENIFDQIGLCGPGRLFLTEAMTYYLTIQVTANTANPVNAVNNG